MEEANVFHRLRSSCKRVENASLRDKKLVSQVKESILVMLISILNFSAKELRKTKQPGPQAVDWNQARRCKAERKKVVTSATYDQEEVHITQMKL